MKKITAFIHHVRSADVIEALRGRRLQKHISAQGEKILRKVDNGDITDSEALSS